MVLAKRSRSNSLPEGIMRKGDILQLPAPKFVVKGLFERNSVGYVYGRRGVRKSLFMLGLAASIATGTPFLGHDIKQSGPVLFVGNEDPNGLGNRIIAWERETEQDTDGKLFYRVERLDLTDPASVAKLIKQARGLKAVAIFLSPFYKMSAGVMENQGEQMQQMTQAIEKIRIATQAFICVENHTSAEGERMSGHSVLEKDAWTEFLLTKKPGNGATTVQCRKQRNFAEREDFSFDLSIHTLGEDEDGDPIDAATVVERKVPGYVDSEVRMEPKSGSIDAHIVNVLRAVQDKPGTRAELMKRTGIAKSSFYKALKVLLDEGKVADVAGTISNGLQIEAPERKELPAGPSTPSQSPEPQRQRETPETGDSRKVKPLKRRPLTKVKKPVVREPKEVNLQK